MRKRERERERFMEGPCVLVREYRRKPEFEYECVGKQRGANGDDKITRREKKMIYLYAYCTWNNSDTTRSKKCTYLNSDVDIQTETKYSPIVKPLSR